MEIRHLRLIKAIVEEGGVTRASARLHLTQSALSHQLREAENRLGARLFLRTGRRLVLTEAGRRLHELALDVLPRIDGAEERIREMARGETGVIRLSTECYTSYHWLPALMRRFRLVYPRVELKIVMEATHRPLEKLLAGELDLAVTSDPVEDPRIRYVKLFRDEMVAVVPESHPWAGRSCVEAEDFADQHLIIHSPPMETVSVHQFVLAPAGVSPKSVVALPLTEAAVEMVRAEMGVTVMARWALRPYLRLGGLTTVRVGSKGLRRDHFIAVPSDRRLPEYVDRFIEFLRGELSLSDPMGEEMPVNVVIPESASTERLLQVLEECFLGAETNGAFLDPGPNGLLDLMRSLTADEASRPVAGPSIASHALHVAFSLDAFIEWIEGERDKSYDWVESWATAEVDEVQWREALERMERRHEDLRAAIERHAPEDPEAAWAAAGVLAHTAFHLGAMQVKKDALAKG